jgi:DNA-binding NarL/FixJ family response regulator
MKQAGLTVLVVDDSMVIRRVVAQLLRNHPRIGRVFEACDAAEGYSLFKITRPDAVVLDLELPDLPGIEVLKMMKSANPACVVIVLTTLAAPQLREECLRLGANWFIPKEQGVTTVPNTIAALCGPGQLPSRAENGCKLPAKAKTQTPP